MRFNKSNMAFEFDYTWKQLEKDNPKISGDPDCTFFDRTAGHEVLYLLNWFNFENLIEFAKAERMIKYSLPANITHQVDVKKWITHNWNNPEFK